MMNSYKQERITDEFIVSEQIKRRNAPFGKFFKKEKPFEQRHPHESHERAGGGMKTQSIGKNIDYKPYQKRYEYNSRPRHVERQFHYYIYIYERRNKSEYMDIVQHKRLQ
jgi:hypothetical protein